MFGLIAGIIGSTIAFGSCCQTEASNRGFRQNAIDSGKKYYYDSSGAQRSTKTGNYLSVVHNQDHTKYMYVDSKTREVVYEVLTYEGELEKYYHRAIEEKKEEELKNKEEALSSGKGYYMGYEVFKSPHTALRYDTKIIYRMTSNDALLKCKPEYRKEYAGIVYFAPNDTVLKIIPTYEWKIIRKKDGCVLDTYTGEYAEWRAKQDMERNTNGLIELVKGERI